MYILIRAILVVFGCTFLGLIFSIYMMNMLYDHNFGQDRYFIVSIISAASLVGVSLFSKVGFFQTLINFITYSLLIGTFGMGVILVVFFMKRVPFGIETKDIVILLITCVSAYFLRRLTLYQNSKIK